MKKLQNFINGQSVDSKSGETTTLINPATGQPFATAPISNAADVDGAMKAASDAFVDWRDSTPSQRQRALLKIADAIEERADEVISIECENTGKPISLNWGKAFSSKPADKTPGSVTISADLPPRSCISFARLAEPPLCKKIDFVV